MILWERPARRVILPDPEPSRSHRSATTSAVRSWAFPAPTHAFLIEHYTTGMRSAHTALSLTNVPVPHAHPARNHHDVRGHWAMTSLRNLAISALRLAGHTNIAAGLRAVVRNPARPLQLLGIPT